LQIERAVEICRYVIVSMDKVHASLNYDVWYIAWRRALPSSKDEDEELIAADKEQWKEYQTNLTAWRSHALQYETEIQGSFGEHGYEALLFVRISQLINQAADTLREIYYCHDSYANMTAERRQTSRTEFDALLKDMRGKIKILSATMIHCIQKLNVGSLRGQDPPDDIPEEWREEAGIPTKRQAEESSTTTEHDEQP
jgi:hypothetical protein